MATTYDLKLRALLDVSQVKQQVQQLNSKNTVNLDASGISHSINLLNQTISKFTNSLEKLSQHTQQAAVKINNASNQAGSNWGKIGKFAAGFAVEHIGSKAQAYFQAAGNDTAASASNFLGKVGRGAVAGSSAGWIGAAGGAIFGGVEFALEELAGNAKKAAEELAHYQQAMETARKTDAAILARENAEKFNTLLSTGSRKQLEIEAMIRASQIAAAESEKLNFRTKWGEQGITAATARLEQIRSGNKTNLIKAKDLSIIKTIEEGSDAAIEEAKNKNVVALKLAEEEKTITQEIDSYLKAEEERTKYTNELKQLNTAIAQRKAAEEQAAKAAAAKAEIERKAAEAEQKRIEIEAKRNEEIIKKLRQTDTEDTESGEISDMLNGGNLQMLHKMLTSVQAKAEWAEAEYNKYLEAGEGDKATEARRQWMRYRGYESSITSGIEGLESKDISKLGDQYRSLLSQLQEQLQPATPVAQLQSMGGNMGWVDRSTESIDNNVQKIVMQLQSILTQIRKTDISQPFILG